MIGGQDAVGNGAPSSEAVHAALQALHPLMLPPAAAWWPQTFASVLVLVLLVLLLVYFGSIVWRRWRARAYRREALARLHYLRTQISDLDFRESAAREIPELMRRTALVIWPRASVSQLCGVSWLAFLDESMGRADRPFLSPSGRLLLDLAYVPAPMIDWQALPALLDLVECWLRTHRPALSKALAR